LPGSPPARAVADGTPSYNRAVPGSTDLLVLEGMSFYGYHGETQAERTLGNRFHVDVEIRIDLSVAGRTDNIADTLDYAHVFELVRGVVEDQQFSLIEALAARIAETLLVQPRIGSVKVRVGKQPPIAGAIDRCWVIIERDGGASS
jgi:dihydroneopterin aldolase